MNLGDIVILTKNQLVMSYKIALVAGKSGTPRHLIGEILGVLGGGLTSGMHELIMATPAILRGSIIVRTPGISAGSESDLMTRLLVRATSMTRPRLSAPVVAGATFTRMSVPDHFTSVHEPACRLTDLKLQLTRSIDTPLTTPLMGSRARARQD